jgi:hypothetical protein
MFLLGAVPFASRREEIAANVLQVRDLSRPRQPRRPPTPLASRRRASRTALGFAVTHGDSGRTKERTLWGDERYAERLEILEQRPECSTICE